MSDDGSVSALRAALEASWSLQFLLVAGSLVGLGCYALGYRIAQRRPPCGSRSLPGYLYVGGAFASFAWYAMPFVPQPRIPGIVDLLQGRPAAPAGIALTTIGAIMGGVFLVVGTRSTIRNLQVTSANFFAPVRLLTDGVYGVIRHPMLMTDVLAHLGVAMAAGATQTLLLMPAYHLINETFVTIQERQVLIPRFGNEYRAYSARTPRMFNRWIAGLVLAAVALICWGLIGSAAPARPLIGPVR